MAGVKRISREEISDIKEADDPWKILVNPAQPSKRRKVTTSESTQPYVYEQNLDEFDSRLNFRYSVTLWGDLVDWKKKGKGPDKFKTFDKVDYSELVIQVGDIVYVNFGDPNAVKMAPAAVQTVISGSTGSDENEDTNGGDTHPRARNPRTESEADPIPDWVAKVLECRAFDEEHVFLRVLWLYRPEDLPGGRKPWHGSHEVFPSNHMQIIDAMTVTGMAGGLIKWSEKVKGNLPTQEEETLLWRQAAKIQTQGGRAVTKVLGKLATYCKCQQPANPDGALIECKACGNWMHDSCIEEEMAKAYSHETVKNEVTGDDVEPSTPTKAEVDGLGLADEEEKPPVKSTHFNPITGAVKMITNQLKRAGTPRKTTGTPSLTQTLLEHVEKALDISTASSGVTYTANITGLDGDAEVEPLRVEITEHKSGEVGKGTVVATQKIRCIFCEKEIE